jgi:ATP-binding cassette subfamily B protein
MPSSLTIRRPAYPALEVRVGLLRLLPAAGPWLGGLLVGVSVAAGLLPVAAALASGALVAAVPGLAGSGPGAAGAREFWRWLALTGALFALAQASWPLRFALGELVRQRVDGVVSERLMRAALAGPRIDHLERPGYLDDLTTASSNNDYTIGQAVVGLVALVPAYVSGLGGMLVVGWFAWPAALLLLVGLVVGRRSVRGGGMAAMRAWFVAARRLREAKYFLELALSPQMAKELRLFELRGWLVDRYRRAATAGMAPVWQARAAMLRGWWRGTYPVMAACAAGAFTLVAVAAVRGELAIAELAVVAQAAALAIDAGAFYPESDYQLEYGGAALPALRSVEAATARPAEPGARRDPAGLPRREIRLEGVRFGYPGASREVLAGVDLVIRAGESVAIVGRNGAGKTTLVKLLTGLYAPTGGRISVDGVPLAELDPLGWQRRFGAIFQDFVRYELPVADNVGFGAPGQLGDQAALGRAADRAGLLGRIQRLPMGWQTPLSRRYAGGVELSGGQWQRLALARALFAVQAGAGVLVLDEPTASLDVRAEAALFDRFVALTRGLTTILVSHRFSTVRRVDRIVVLDDGRIVEDGSHAELLGRGGRYAEMFALQASRFRARPAPPRATGPPAGPQGAPDA